MRVVVTGAAGFVGAHAVARLLAAGHEVHGFTEDGSAPPGASGRRIDVREAVPRARLLEGHREPLLPRDRRREPRRLLRRGCVREQRAGEHDRGDVRLGREAPAERFRDQHHLGHAQAEAAVRLGEGDPGPAEIGHLAPYPRRVAELVGGVA